MPRRKLITWMGSSRKDLIAMPVAVKKDFGGALHAVQDGRTPDGAKALKGKAQGAIQLSEDHDGET
jgi:phage-related protein